MDTTTFLIVSNVLLWLCVVTIAIVLWTTFRLVQAFTQELRNSGVLNGDAVGLRQGNTAPAFSLISSDGSQLNNSSLTGDLNALLFVSPNCPTCSATAMELEGLGMKTSGNFSLICLGNSDECGDLESSLEGAFPFAVDAEGITGRAFGIVKTPTAVLIDREGKVDRFGSPTRASDLESLVPELFEEQNPFGVSPDKGRREVA